MSGLELELSFNLELPDESEKRERSKKAKEKKKASEETIEEAFDRVGSMKLSEKEAELYALARKAFFAGEIGRLGDGKLTKGEVLSMGAAVAKKKEAALREARIREVLENKPPNFHILTDDRDLPQFIENVRDEVRRQLVEWAGRFDRLGVKSMTAGDYEGSGVDSWLDLSIGFAIWLPLRNEGYYLPYGHVSGFDVPFPFKDGDPQLTRSKVIKTIAPYLSNRKHGKTFHMGAPCYDMHMAINDGYEIGGLVWDTLRAMYIMTEHLDSYALKSLIQRYGSRFLGIEGEVYTFEDLFGNRSPAPFNTEIVGIYAIRDVYYGWKLFEWQFETMKKTNRLLDCYVTIDSKLPDVDIMLARSGFCVDLDELASLEEEFTAKIEEAKAAVFEAYSIDESFIYKMNMMLHGDKIRKWQETQENKREKLKERLEKYTEVALQCEKQGKTHLKRYKDAVEKIRSTKEEIAELDRLTVKDCPDYVRSFDLTNNNHIGYLIYDHLRIEDKTYKVKKGKKRSTAADVLEMYFEDEESLRPLATVADYQKLLNTYVQRIPEALEVTGRIHAFFDATGTSTGRYSSSTYNARPIDILDEFKKGA